MIIVLEGIDNCGKTTISEKLAQDYEQMGYSVFVSKELTTDIGNLIKKSYPGGVLSPIMKTFLFAADRQLRIENIRNEHNFDILIFDRYLHSAIAYREAEGIDEQWIREVNRFVPPFDIGFYIDISPEESIHRNTSKKFNINYSIEYLTQVRNSYLRRVSDGALIMIDGMRNIEDVYYEIMDILQKQMPNRSSL